MRGKFKSRSGGGNSFDIPSHQLNGVNTKVMTTPCHTELQPCFDGPHGGGGGLNKELNR
jgi:hypothetical protein